MNNQFQSIVFGYARSIEDDLFNGNVPHYLLCLCLSYYYQDDYFYDCGDSITISKDKKTATKFYGANQGTVKTYGKLWINCDFHQIAEWTLKVNEGDASCSSLQVMFMVKNSNSSTVIFSETCRIKPQSGQEYKVSLNTKDGSFNVSKIGKFVIEEIIQKENRYHCNCKLVLNLDSVVEELSITMTNFVLRRQ